MKVILPWLLLCLGVRLTCGEKGSPSQLPYVVVSDPITRRFQDMAASSYGFRQIPADVTQDVAKKDGVAPTDVTQDGVTSGDQPRLPIFYMVSSKMFPDNLLNRLGLIMKKVPEETSPQWRQPHPGFIPPPHFEHPYPPYYPYQGTDGYPPYDGYPYYPQRPDRFSYPPYPQYGYPYQNSHKKKKPYIPEHYYQNEYYSERPQYPRPPKPSKVHRPPPNHPQYSDHDGYQPPSNNKNKPRPHLEKFSDRPTNNKDVNVGYGQLPFTNLNLPSRFQGSLTPSLAASPVSETSPSTSSEDDVPALQVQTTVKPAPPLPPALELPFTNLNLPTSLQGFKPSLSPLVDNKPEVGTKPKDSTSKVKIEKDKTKTIPENSTATTQTVPQAILPLPVTVDQKVTIVMDAGPKSKPTLEPVHISQFEHSGILVEIKKPSKQSEPTVLSTDQPLPVLTADKNKHAESETKPIQDIFTVIEYLDKKNTDMKQSSKPTPSNAQPAEHAEIFGSTPSRPHVQLVEIEESLGTKPTPQNVQPVQSIDIVDSKPNVQQVEKTEVTVPSSKPTKQNFPFVNTNLPIVVPVGTKPSLKPGPVSKPTAVEGTSSDKNKDKVTLTPAKPITFIDANIPVNNLNLPSFPQGGPKPSLKPVLKPKPTLPEKPVKDENITTRPETSTKPQTIPISTDSKLKLTNRPAPKGSEKEIATHTVAEKAGHNRKPANTLRVESRESEDHVEKAESNRKPTNTLRVESGETKLVTSELSEKDPAIPVYKDVLFVMRRKPSDASDGAASALVTGSGSSSLYPHKTLDAAPVVRYASMYDPTYDGYWG